LLDKTVAAVKADRDLALGMFNKGEGGFKDRDLYPFCFRGGDGKQLGSQAATPTGIDVRTLKDPTGNMFGQELYAAAQKPEGQITEVSYMFPKPGTTAPVFPKVSFVTRVGDLGCGVGYYK
jgi:signal transduction histidine kinase